MSKVRFNWKGGRGHAVRRLLGGLLLGAGLAWGAGWQHGASPYRATFQIESRPDPAEAGVFVHVPVCGLAEMDGADLVAYDDRDRLLPVRALGPGLDNTVLAVVAAPADSQELYLYFGGRMPAPQNPQLLHGVVVEIRPWQGPAPAKWADAAKVVDKTPPQAILPLDHIALSYNPMDSRDAFAMSFRGWLRQPPGGKQTLMLTCDDAGYLFLHDKLLLERNGTHGAGESARGECRADAAFPEPWTAFRLVVVDAGGEQMAVLARWRDPHNKSILTRADFAASGRTRLTTAEARGDRAAFPAFTCEPRSYIGWRDRYFTEVEFHALNGQLTEWTFGDGARLVGATIRRILPGLTGMTVEARQGQLLARGRVDLPENPPPQVKIGQFQRFKEYAAAIRQENLAQLPADTLRAYRDLFQFEDLNPDLVAVDDALLAKPDLPGAERAGLLLEAARCAAARDPEKSAAWYDQALKATPPPEALRVIAREAAEFHLLRRPNQPVALALADRLAQTRDDQAAYDALTLRYLAATLRGDTATAAAQWQQLNLASARWRDRAALPAAKKNELAPRVEDLLDRGFLLEAREQLRLWERLAPEDWRNGRLPYARARLWHRSGWPFAAIAELEAASKMEPLLPNLPAVELYQGLIFLEIGHRDAGRKLLEKVRAEYPNHPAAAEARRKLATLP